MKDFKNLLQSKVSTRVLVGIGTALVVLVIFQAGVLVGYHKAAFSYRSGENYYKTFTGERRGFRGIGMPGENFSTAHGALGKIIKIDLPKVVIEDRDSIEKIIDVNNNTIIRRFQESLQPQDLKLGDTVLVVGSPDENAEIDARLIRLLPAETFTISTGTPKK